MRSAGDLVMCLGDLNGHVCRHIDGFDGVHGAYVVVQWNLEGRMILVLSGEGIMSSTWIKRGKEEGDIQMGRKMKL